MTVTTFVSIGGSNRLASSRNLVTKQTWWRTAVNRMDTEAAHGCSMYDIPLWRDQQWHST